MSAYAAKPRVEIDGSALSAELDVRLEHALVDDTLSLPDMFELRFRNDRDVLARAGFAIGSKVRILATPLGQGRLRPLLVGEVTALEAQFDGRGSHLVLRGYDPSHRLHRGRRTRSWEQLTDSDVVRQVAQDAGLEIGTLDETSIRHAHVTQANLTDWEFLKARARTIGYEVGVVDGKLDFRRPAEAGQAPPPGDFASRGPKQLVLGRDLERFHPRVTSAEQVGEVEVRGWDPSHKRAVVGHAPGETTSVSLEVTPAELARKFGNPTYVSVDRPFSTQAEVDAAARALADQVACTFAEADGVTRGNPELTSGTPISVGLAGPAFSGRYTITASRHVFDTAGYRTHFVVSGRQDRSLLGLASLGATNGALSPSGPPIYGLVIGQITDVRDPEHTGRVKLKFPWLSDTYASDWVRVVQAGAGHERGFMIVPEVDDEVLVGFEHGDVRRPYVLGGLYNGIDKPKETTTPLVDRGSGAVDFRWFMSRLGHVVSFADGSNGGGILIQTARATQEIALNAAANRVRVKSNGDVEIMAGGKLTITAGTDLSIQAGNTLSLDAAQIKLHAESELELKADAHAALEGSNVDVKASAAADIDGGATCSVHAGLVRIN